jgi:large subunit ribosomal protein L3
MSYTMLRKGILGRKIGMTQVFAENGDVQPCTVVEAGPCVVTQVKTADADGYDAVQIAFLPKREKVTSKPMKGHFKKAGVESHRHLREIRLPAGSSTDLKVGDKVTASAFAAGEYVDVIGTMKGRGYAGVVKRHGFATMKESHGAHYFWRHAGSIGCRKPEHTRGGTRMSRMSGHMGDSRVTVQSLRLLRVEGEKNLLYVRGCVPGANGGLLMIRPAKRRPAPAAAAKA